MDEGRTAIFVTSRLSSAGRWTLPLDINPAEGLRGLLESTGDQTARQAAQKFGQRESCAEV